MVSSPADAAWRYLMLYARIGSAAFIGDACEGAYTSNAAWTHCIPSPDGSWSMLTTNERLAQRAICAGGVDRRDLGARRALCR